MCKAVPAVCTHFDSAPLPVNPHSEVTISTRRPSWAFQATCTEPTRAGHHLRRAKLDLAVVYLGTPAGTGSRSIDRFGLRPGRKMPVPVRSHPVGGRRLRQSRPLCRGTEVPAAPPAPGRAGRPAAAARAALAGCPAGQCAWPGPELEIQPGVKFPVTSRLPRRLAPTRTRGPEGHSPSAPARPGATVSSRATGRSRWHWQPEAESCRRGPTRVTAAASRRGRRLGGH
jgi:hypothetical protein